MTKPSARLKIPTHFEQIPIEVVKKIVESDVSSGDKAGTNTVTAGPAPGSKRPQKAPARSLAKKGR